MASTSFEVRYRDGLARIGKFTTPHGNVTTPTLLPVINPAYFPVSVETMKEIGAEMIITNSYIIHSRDELREKALANGVHSLVGDIPIMTDSGTFQMYMYGRVRVTNEQIIQFQREIGTDVGTILDLFTVPGTAEEQAREEAAETLERARAGVDLKEGMALAGPVQGGIYPEVREWHARELSGLDLDFHPIGGVVPLMENGNYSTLTRVIIGAKKGLIPSRPVHLFGAGHPMVFPLAAYLGCDFFDSSSYIKYAKDGRLRFPDCTKRLEDIQELGCSCPICSSTTASELKTHPMDIRIEKISLHNLYVSFSEIRRIRDAIRYGNLRELVESRLTSNPNLLPVMEVLKQETKYLECYEPISRRSAFYFTGPGSLARPNVMRYRERFYTRYFPEVKNGRAPIILFPEGQKPYSREYAAEIHEVRQITGARFFVNSIYGPVPLELDEMYPIAQSVVPAELDKVTEGEMTETMKTFSHALPPGLALIWDDSSLDTLKMLSGSRVEPRRTGILDSDRVKAVADMQFGKGARRIFEGNIRIVKSKRTGKIRNVYVDDEHLVSMRAHDGLFTLKSDGARKLMKVIPYPGIRVVIENDAVEFVAQGKNVFSKFVLEMDEDLRPMDEVIIVDSMDNLVGIGQVVLVRDEAKAFQRGIAVKVREGVGWTAITDPVDPETEKTTEPGT